MSGSFDVTLNGSSQAKNAHFGIYDLPIKRSYALSRWFYGNIRGDQPVGLVTREDMKGRYNVGSLKCLTYGLIGEVAKHRRRSRLDSHVTSRKSAARR